VEVYGLKRLTGALLVFSLERAVGRPTIGGDAVYWPITQSATDTLALGGGHWLLETRHYSAAAGWHLARLPASFRAATSP